MLFPVQKDDIKDFTWLDLVGMSSDGGRSDRKAETPLGKPVRSILSGRSRLPG